MIGLTKSLAADLVGRKVLVLLSLSLLGPSLLLSLSAMLTQSYCNSYIPHCTIFISIMMITTTKIRTIKTTILLQVCVNAVCPGTVETPSWHVSFYDDDDDEEEDEEDSNDAGDGVVVMALMLMTLKMIISSTHCHRAG